MDAPRACAAGRLDDALDRDDHGVRAVAVNEVPRTGDLHKLTAAGEPRVGHLALLPEPHSLSRCAGRKDGAGERDERHVRERRRGLHLPRARADVDVWAKSRKGKFESPLSLPQRMRSSTRAWPRWVRSSWAMSAPCWSVMNTWWRQPSLSIKDSWAPGRARSLRQIARALGPAREVERELTDERLLTLLAPG